jgi:hypothetical protein
MNHKKLVENISYASELQDAKSTYPLLKDHVALVERLKVRLCITKYCKTNEQLIKNESKIKILKQLIALHEIRNN